MRLQLLSDLHLEWCPQLVPPAVPGTDVLVLAGDVGSYQRGSRLDGDDFGLGRFSPRRAGAPWKRVLYVPGNHEYDELDYDATRERLRTLCERLGIDWLERETLVVDGVRFVGTTLWADFDALAARERTLAGQYRQREKAFGAANFYLARNPILRRGAAVMAADVRELALESQAWLRDALARPFAGPTVAVTHFAPSLRSADPRYGLSPGTAGFCNALDDLLPRADLWLHGHLHCALDYVVSGVDGARRFSCRVVANPLGYADKGEQASFRPDLSIEVPARGASR